MKPLKRMFPARGRELIPERIRCQEKGPRRNLFIHHYCPHTFNAGDHFVVRSIRRHLQRHLPEAVFVPKAVAANRGWGQPIGLRGENIRYSNEFADAVLVGGSDQYNNWGPRITAEEIECLKPPLFLIGLGVSSKDLDQQPYIKKPEYRRDILAVNEKAASSSVRDEITAEFLRGLGFDRAVVTGCPALYLFDRPLRATGDGHPVLLTFPFPLARDEAQRHKYRILIETMKQLIIEVKRDGEDCIVVCHDDRDVLPAQEHFPEAPVFFSNYVDDYFPLYESARMIVGSRLHATILGLGMGVPSVNIDLDLRGQGFTRSFGLQEWNLDYRDPRLPDALRRRWRQIASRDLTGLAEFEKERDQYRVAFDRFMTEVAARIRNRAGSELPAS